MRLILSLLAVFILLYSMNVSAHEKRACGGGSLPDSEYFAKVAMDTIYHDGIHSGKSVQQRGCCSWHQGVCGCSNGRVTCCDGTVSPSCMC